MKNLEDAAKFPSEKPNPVLRVTKNKVLYVNKAGERLFSIKEGDKIPKFFQSELTEALNANILKTFEIEIDDLSYILDFSPIKEEGYVNIYGKDITERKQIELDLKHKKSELESIFRAAPTGIGVVINRVFKQVNDRFCELVGYTREELLNKSARMVYPSDEDYEYVGKEKYAQIEVSGSGTVDTRFKRKDGKIINILLSSALIDFDQPSVGTTFTALDITERKITEQKLKKSEEKYRKLIESAQEGIWVIDKDAYTTFVNPKMAEMLGYVQDEMFGKHLFDFMNEEGIAIANKKLERRKLGIEEQHDFEFLRKDGTKIYTLLETSTLTDESGEYDGALAFISDIT
ncbi:MAG: PAS domain-containing protein, partial [Candidatus Lokiarchaeota archaeon]|nr:PAS domain-containing protein [Candidatus Lokiarchaeota archaeon]